MNERILELAEQATTIVDTVNSQGFSSSYANFDREKFAELIVQECICALNKDDGATHHGELLREYFGIER
jgi:hypothetical protein